MFILWWGLQILFVGLKLGRIIDWQWWQVLLPVEISVTIFVAVVTFSITAGLFHAHFMKTDSNYALQHHLKALADKYKRR